MSNENNKPDPEALVTLAIRTYERAVMLKTYLESEGIEAVITNVNQLVPVISSGVRVRIREKDLPKALKLIEKFDLKIDEEYPIYEEERFDDKGLRKEILVPVDFSDYTMKTCDFAFDLAYRNNCKIKILHTYYSPYYPPAFPLGDPFSIQVVGEENYWETIKQKSEESLKELTDQLNKKIASKELPSVTFRTILRGGLPEDEIISYSKKYHPHAIVMGTRGKNQKDIDLIGSVTAEVIESGKTSVFAIPENVTVDSLKNIDHILFLTNLQQRDLIIFDELTNFFSGKKIKVDLAHIKLKEDSLNEIKLAGFKEYFTKNYPNVEVSYQTLEGGSDFEVNVDNYVKEHGIKLIALSTSRRNIFARMFNPGIARRMLFHSDTPLLVLKI